MTKDKTVTVTVRLTEKLHRLVRMRLAEESATLQRIVTEALEAYVSTPPIKARMTQVILDETQRSK